MRLKMTSLAFLATAGAIVLLATGFSLASQQADAAKRGGNGIVVFTANWCASCRSVIPIAQEVGSQNGLAVDTIDVDKQDAPSLAANYGLSLPSADLPQVYHVNQGRITLLFDARQYKFAKPEMIRSQLLSNLQQAKSN